MVVTLDMEALLSSSAATATTFAAAPATNILTFLAKPTTISHPKIFPLTVSFSTKTTPHNLLFPISTFSSSLSTKVRAEPSSTFTSSTAPSGKNGASYGNRHWMVLVEPPLQQLTTKSQIIDYYVCKLESVLGSETDAQMCMYDASCDTHFGFCCDIDEETAHDLATVHGVLSVERDENFGSDDKDYGGEVSKACEDSCLTSNIKTKKLFVTGLSFYTSEKTLRSAFEGFGELVEVKIIMDKISKRSKGYAFVKYTTEEAASAALTEMNGKIINGWMITVDVANKNPPKYSRGQARPTS